MTKSEVVTRVRTNLDDIGITFYTDQAINASVQDGFDETVALTRCLEQSATISFADEKTYYNLYELIPDYISTFAIHNNNTNRWLLPSTVREFEDDRDNWELYNGQPQFFAPISFQYIAIYPRLTSAVGDMTVYYKAKAPQLQDNDEIPILELGESIIEDYATIDGLEQAFEFAKALEYFKTYLNSIEQAKIKVANRSLTDRILQLQSANIEIPAASSGGGGISQGVTEVATDFVDDETPSGTINGSNNVFTLAFTPNPAKSLELNLNGVEQVQNIDYTLSANTITFASGKTPQVGDTLRARYRR